MFARNALALIAGLGLGGGLAARFVFDAPALGRLILLGALVLAGGPLVARTLWGMMRGRFAADIVAMLAIGTSLVLGEYFAGVVIVLMQAGGEALERYALRRASQSLELLLARAPKIAHRMRDGVLEDVAVEAVAIGDRLVVKPGDLVPVDGEAVAGSATVDQSAITGEPLPIRAVPGTRVLSGSVTQDGVLEIRALRQSSQSQYQRIVRLVERARREKPPIQRLADRYAVWFTPLTLLMCGVAWLLTRDATAVLGVLVVATPCPLILATPVAVISAVSRAARAGIIVKAGAAVEQVGRARVVIFDKTGTLTLGRPTVSHVDGFDARSSGDVLRLAGAVEQFSSHHLGLAIAEAARRKGGTLPIATEFIETPGQGVSGRVDGQVVHVGSTRYLRARGITSVEGSPDGTTAHVAVNGRLAGAIEFADRLRHQVPALMQRLAVLGVSDTVMLTGDHQASAEAIAAQAGIRMVRANLLPGDKVAAVRELKDRYAVVVMVGDGINDAPALAAATVGIAMGEHGTAVSAEAADIVLLVDDISRVADAMTISRRMRRIALQSIGIGLGVSFALMVVASLGYIAPPAGAVMQEALDAAVILNSLRAR